MNNQAHSYISLDKYTKRRGVHRERFQFSEEEGRNGQRKAKPSRDKLVQEFPDWVGHVLGTQRWKVEHVHPTFVEQALANILHNGAKTPKVGLTINPGKLHEQAFALKHSRIGLKAVSALVQQGRVVAFAPVATKGPARERPKGFIYSVDGTPFHQLTPEVMEEVVDSGLYKGRNQKSPHLSKSKMKRLNKRATLRMTSQLNGNQGEVTGTDDHPQGRRRGPADSGKQTPLQRAFNNDRNEARKGTIDTAIEQVERVQGNGGRHKRNSRRRPGGSGNPNPNQKQGGKNPTQDVGQVQSEISKDAESHAPLEKEVKITVKPDTSVPVVSPPARVVSKANIGIVYNDDMLTSRLLRALKYFSVPLCTLLTLLALVFANVVVDISHPSFMVGVWVYICLVWMPCAYLYLFRREGSDMQHSISGSVYDGMTFANRDVKSFKWWTQDYNLRGLGFNAYVVRDVDVGIVNDLLHKYGGVKVTSDTMRLFMAQVMQELGARGAYRDIDFNVARDSAVAAYQQKCLLTVCGNQATGNVGNPWSYMSPHVL